MRNQLTAYVDLLFAGKPEMEDARQEILQNTLDRYDDLIADGKSPQAAYTLAISGLGDVGELLSPEPQAPAPAAGNRKSVYKAAAVALYILCPIPLFVLQNELGLSLLLVIVAAATGLMLLGGHVKKAERAALSPRQQLAKSICSVISTVLLILYVLVSFYTMAWHITWLIFPIMGAVNQLVKACLQLREEPK